MVVAHTGHSNMLFETLCPGLRSAGSDCARTLSTFNDPFLEIVLSLKVVDHS